MSSCKPHCFDGVANGDETDDDCGGSCGATCVSGLGCRVGADCASNVCFRQRCEPAPADHGQFGAGTPQDPYLLYTAEQVVSLSQTQADWDKHYVQMQDIDMSGYDERSLSTIGTQAAPFVGTLDGRGFTISNFTYRMPGVDYVGLFGHVSGSSADIRNVHLVNVSVTGNLRTGGLVGSVAFGSIVNSSASGVVNGFRHVGGLVGVCEYGAVVSTGSSAAVVSANENRVGGLVGSTVRFCHVINSYATGDVGGVDNLGGLIGFAGFGQVVNGCYATGSAVSTGSGVGGLVGTAVTDTAITDSFATGAVTCDDSGSTCGALVGEMLGVVSIANVYFDASANCDTQSAVPCNVLGTGVDLATMPNYFFAVTAEPLLSMNFASVWTQADNDYPILAPNLLDVAAWGDCVSHTNDAPFAGGVGSYENPYLICTATQLQAIGTSPDTLRAHYALAAGLDLSGYTGTSFAMIGASGTPFAGTFRGRGYVLSNFSYNDSAADYVGVFRAAEHALFSRVGLRGVDVVASENVGSLLGEGRSTQVVAAYSTGSVSGTTRVGGVVGHGAYVHNSYSLASVSGDDQVGGIIGNSTVVADSFTVGSVMGTGTSVGPVVGATGASTVNSYYASGGCTGCDSWANTEIDLSGGNAGWFYNATNPPFGGVWDFANTWQEAVSDYPRLVVDSP